MKSNKLSIFEGKTVHKVIHSEVDSGTITFIFTDNSAVIIDAEGDDMSHTTIDIYEDLNS